MQSNEFIASSFRLNSFLKPENQKKITTSGELAVGCSLESVLDNTILMNYLLEFASKTYCEENILFIKAVRHFRADFLNLSPAARLQKAKEIYEKYIAETAKHELNLNYETRQEVKKFIQQNNITVNTFQQSEVEIYALIEADLFPKFQQNSLYSDAILAYEKICDMSSCSIKSDKEKKLQFAHWKNIIFSDIDYFDVPAREYLIRQTQPSHYLYYIHSGEVKVTKDFINSKGEKDEITIAKLTDNQIIGEMSFLGRFNCTANVITTQISQIKKIKYKHLLNILYSNSTLSLLFFHSMGFHLAKILHKNTAYFKISFENSPLRKTLSPSSLNQNLVSSSPIPSLFLPSTPRASHSSLLNNDEDPSLRKFLKKFPELVNDYVILLSHQKCTIIKRHFQCKGKLFITKSFICYSSAFFSHNFREWYFFNQITNISRKQKQMKFQIDGKTNKLSFKTEEITQQLFDLLSSLIQSHDNNNNNINNNNNTNNNNTSINNLPCGRRDSVGVPIIDKFQMNSNDWDQILALSSSQIVCFAKDDIVIQQSSTDNFNLLAQIVKGKCRVVKEKKKFAKIDAKVVGYAKKGEVIGELMFLTECTPNVSVIADEDVKMVVLNGAYIKEKLFNSNPDLAVRFYRHLCSIIAYRINDTEKLLFPNS